MLGSMLPVCCPSLQGSRSAKRGRGGEKYKSRGMRVHERLAW